MNKVLLVTLVVFAVADADISRSNPASGTCLCVSGSGVNVRSSACGGIIGQAENGSCYKYKGTKQACRLGSTTYQFFKLEYGSGGWVAGNYLTIGTTSRCGNSNSGPVSLPTGSCPRVVSRSEWGARKPKFTSNIRHPVPRVVIHHTEGNSCSNQAECSRTLKGIQNYHMDNKGWSDIGYNFLVGEDGKVYEGVGWNRVGAHAKDYNSQAIGISVMGNFMSRRPNEAALNAVKQLIACGVREGKISSQYSLHGHRDVGSTNCPGNSLYAVIKTWPNFKGRV